MAISASDPNMLLFYPLNENTPTGIRYNRGSLGDDERLRLWPIAGGLIGYGPKNPTWGRLLPDYASTYQYYVNDFPTGPNRPVKHFPRDVNHFGNGCVHSAPYLDSATGNVDSVACFGHPTTPDASDGESQLITENGYRKWWRDNGLHNSLRSTDSDWAYGFEFTLGNFDNSGNTSYVYQHIGSFATQGVGDVGGYVSVTAYPGSVQNPAQWRLRVAPTPNNWGSSGEANSTDCVATGSPPSYYILPRVTYRLIMRFYNSGVESLKRCMLHLYGSDGTYYTFACNGTPSSYSANTSFFVEARYTDETYQYATGMCFGGADGSPSTTYPDLLLANIWYYRGTINDVDAEAIARSGLSIPYTEPDYYKAAAKIRHAVSSERRNDFPMTRVLPTGAMSCRHPVNALGMRFKQRYEGYEVARPASIIGSTPFFDAQGPRASRQGNEGPMPQMAGIGRTFGKDFIKARDARNMARPGAYPRTRRGYKIRGQDTAFDTGINSIHSFRDNRGGIIQLGKIGTRLLFANGDAGYWTEIDASGSWELAERASFINFDDRVIILTPSRQRWMYSGDAATRAVGVTPTQTASVAASSGGTLNGTYYYAWTEYDPTSGDESTPVVSSSVSPSTQKVTLTMPAVNSDTRFSYRRIYRTTAGGAPPDLYLIDTVATATSYIDTGEVDGTVAVGSVNGSYITSTPPQTPSFGCVHNGRVFYVSDQRLFWSEADEPFRWYAQAYLDFDEVVTAVASKANKLVVFTRNKTWIVESDFIRNEDGSYNIFRHCASTNVGCYNHVSVVDIDDNLFWIDRRGIFKMEGDAPIIISGDIQEMLRWVNAGLTLHPWAAYHHFDKQVWFGVPYSTQYDNSKCRTVFVYQLDKNEWWIHDIELAHCTQIDDDNNGQQLAGVDYLGTYKLLNTYEADGVEGDESYTLATTVSSISGKIITATGSPGWTADELRGVEVTLRDVSTGLLYKRTITDNDTATITLDDVPSAIAASDEIFIGGILWYLETHESDYGSRNQKVLREVEHQFSDATQDEYA